MTSGGEPLTASLCRIGLGKLLPLTGLHVIICKMGCVRWSLRVFSAPDWFYPIPCWGHFTSQHPRIEKVSWRWGGSTMKLEGPHGP